MNVAKMLVNSVCSHVLVDVDNNRPIPHEQFRENCSTFTQGAKALPLSFS